MPSYPTTVPTFTTKVDGAGNLILASHVNALQVEVESLAQGLLNGLFHHLLPNATATRDIGSTGVRWRDGWFSRDVAVAGDIAVTGEVAYGSLNPPISSFDGLWGSLDFTTSSLADVTTRSAAVLNTGTLPNARIVALPYANLSLGDSILNADINSAAAIAWSKITKDVVNADVNAAAAIAWTKISKSGSSLADLATKSAAALDTGELADARLSSNVPLINASNVFTGAAQTLPTALVDAGGSALTARVGGTIYTDHVANPTVGASEETLYTQSLAAALLDVDNQYIEFDVLVTMAANTNSKTIRVKFGGTTVVTFATSSSSHTSLRLRGVIMRTGATTQLAWVGDDELNPTVTTPAETLSGAVTFAVTGDGVSASDIQYEAAIIKWHPAGN